MRYENVTQYEEDLKEWLAAEYFQDIQGVKVKLLFDTKKVVGSGKIVLGKCRKSDDLIRHLTQDEAQTILGFDFIIVLDKLCWDNIEEVDKIRILRHELRHIRWDGVKWDIRPHDIEDFSDEIELNEDDITWAGRVAEKLTLLYEWKAEMEKQTGSVPDMSGAKLDRLPPGREVTSIIIK